MKNQKFKYLTFHIFFLVLLASWVSSCEIPKGMTLHPFSFRGHTHFIGKLISAYIVDGATRSNWTLISKTDPSLPQINEDLNNHLVSLTFLSIFLQDFYFW